MLLVVMLVANYALARHWQDEYGVPYVVLTVTDPWLMVIGSDVPTIAIYERGDVIYKNPDGYFTVKLDSTQLDALWNQLQISQELLDLPDYIAASQATDMPTNYLMLVSDTVRMKTVYGDLQQDETSRARTPETFLSVYDQLVNYRNEQAEKWLPDTVEVMLTRFDHSVEKPVAWPEGWPDLNDKTTVSITPNLYSVFIPKSEFDNLLKLLSSLSYRRAVEINGRKFSVTYRLPFPNLR